MSPPKALVGGSASGKGRKMHNRTVSAPDESNHGLEVYGMSVERMVNQGLSFVLAVGLLYFGVRGLIGRRPLVFSVRWAPAAITLILFKELTPLRHPEGVPYGTILAVAVGVMYCFYVSGYVVFGIDEPALRTALGHVLDARGLSHENRPGVIHIPSEKLDLQLQPNEWGNTASVRVTPARGRPLLSELGKELKSYFSSQPAPPRRSALVLYTYVGALLVAVGLLLMR